MTIHDKYKQCRAMPRSNSGEIDRATVKYRELLSDVEKVLIDVKIPNWIEMAKLRNLVLDDIMTMRELRKNAVRNMNPHGEELLMHIKNTQIRNNYYE